MKNSEYLAFQFMNVWFKSWQSKEFHFTDMTTYSDIILFFRTLIRITQMRWILIKTKSLQLKETQI